MKFIFLLAAVFAQSCIPLPPNTPCGPSFKNYPITKPVDQFVSSLISRVQNLNTTAQGLIDNNVCGAGIKDTIRNTRYQVSMNCGREVMNAIQSGCKVADPSLQSVGMLLCQGECDLSVQTLKNLNDKSICPGDIITTGVEGYCQYSRDGVAKGAKCFDAVMEEASFAGFGTAQLAQEKCSSPQLANDVYCKAFLNPPKSDNKGLIILIVAISGGVVFLALIGCCVYRLRRARKTNDQENVTPVLEKKASRKSIDPRTSYLSQKEFITPDYTGANVDKTKSFLKPATPLEEETGEITLEDLPEGSRKLLILHPYTSTLDDELTLVQGQSVFLIREFDDGWALGVDPVSGSQGAFPMVCVADAEGKQDRTSKRISNRLSSMVINKVDEVSVRRKVPFSMYLKQLEKVEGESEVDGE